MHSTGDSAVAIDESISTRRQTDDAKIAAIAEQHEAFLDATHIVLRWAIHDCVLPYPFATWGEQQIIQNRSDWLLDRYLRQWLIEFGVESPTIYDLGIELVTAGFDPSTLPAEMDESTVLSFLERRADLNEWAWFGRDDPLPEQYQRTRSLLRDYWPSIEALAATIRERSSMTATEVWEVMLPGVSYAQRIGAYHLAGSAVCATLVGLAPEYLSIFCDWDYQIWYSFVRSSRDEQIPTRDTALVSLAGPIASLRATGEARLEMVDGYLTGIFESKPDEAADWLPGSTMFVETGLRASEIVNTHWKTIETLATLLLREYSLLGDEIKFVLDGGDIDDWARLY